VRPAEANPTLASDVGGPEFVFNGLQTAGTLRSFSNQRNNRFFPKATDGSRCAAQVILLGED
jgi:hypothetical protein